MTPPETGQSVGSCGAGTVARGNHESSPKRNRRLPHVVDLERDEPFRSEDREQLLAQCVRITNGQDFWFGQNRRWNYVVQFAERHHAEALKHWIWEERFTSRPLARFGPSKEERDTFSSEFVAWGLRTGALRRVLSAYRAALQDGQSLMKCRTAAQLALRPYLPPDHGKFDPSRAMVNWGEANHREWIEGRRLPATAAPPAPEWWAPDEAYAHSED